MRTGNTNTSNEQQRQAPSAPTPPHPHRPSVPIPPIGSPGLTRVLGLGSLAAPLALYYLTTCPVVYYGDAGELIVAAWRWGIAHPPGYPIYVLLLALFLRLPIGFLAPDAEFIQPIAWQANVLSAVLGAVTIWLVYLILLRLLRRPIWAFVGSFLVATGRTFWSQTGIAEVYTLNALLGSLLVLLALVQSEARPGSRRRLVLLRWGSLVWGLSLCNHHESAFLIPVWLTMLVLALQKPPRDERVSAPPGRVILDALLFFAVGLLPYLYLPIASAFKPVINWGDPSSLEGFWRVVTRAEYRAVKEHITGDLVTSGDILLKFLWWTATQYFPVVPLLAIPGIAVLLRRSPHRPVLISAAISILAMTAVFIIYFAGIDRGSLFFLEVYFIPWYMALGILTVMGTAVLFGVGSLHSPDLPTARRALAALLILALALVGGTVNRRVCDMSDNLAGYVYSHDVLATVTSSEDKAILVTGGDEIFLFWYWQWVEEEGKDVVCIGMDALSVGSSWFWDDLLRAHPGLALSGFEELAARYSGDELRWRALDSLVRANADTHRCWMTAWDPAFDPLIHQGPWHMVLDGPALELERDREGRMVDYPRASIPASEYLFRALLDLDRSGLEPFEREVYDRYAAACYNLALYFWRNDDPAQAAEFAKLCLLFRPGYSAGENTYKPEELLAFNLLEAGDLSLAQTTLEDLIQKDPNNSLYHAYLGEVFIAQGDFEAARRELELALRLEPDNQFILERYREVFQEVEDESGDEE